MNNLELTPFQRSAKEKISREIEKGGFSVRFAAEGKNETYLFAEIPKDELRLWIYEDELELRANNLHRLLEAQNFESQEKMLAYFLSELSAVLRG
jgi:hypothetical protein